jgi:hypothetical protein
MCVWLALAIYPSQQGSILGLMGDEEDQDTRDRKMHAIYGGLSLPLPPLSMLHSKGSCLVLLCFPTLCKLIQIYLVTNYELVRWSRVAGTDCQKQSHL